MESLLKYIHEPFRLLFLQFFLFFFMTYHMENFSSAKCLAPFTICSILLSQSLSNNSNLLQSLVEQEVSQLSAVILDHLAQCGNLAGDVTLALVLFSQEVSGEIISKLY